MSSSRLPSIGVIGTGGTIASVGAGPLDLRDYADTGIRLDTAALVDRAGLDGVVARVSSVDFGSIDSTAITAADWNGLAQLCADMARDNPDMAGIVLMHGTASLEETAYALSLVHDIAIPVVVTGAMRPISALSSDGPANLAAALAVAASGRNGVFVVMDNRIHAPAAVTKTDTMRLDAFNSPAGGVLGEIDGSQVRWHGPSPASGGCFPSHLLGRLPRVDIAFSHVGADGCAIRAFVDAGAAGIVSAGFGPGMTTPAEMEALAEAVRGGVTVVQGFRGAAGRVTATSDQKKLGIIPAGDLTPQKARILLALCLARGDGAQEIQAAFHSACAPSA